MRLPSSTSMRMRSGDLKRICAVAPSSPNSYMNSAVSMSDAVRSEAIASSPSSSTLSAVARNNPQDGSMVNAVMAAAASSAFPICSFIKQLLLWCLYLRLRLPRAPARSVRARLPSLLRGRKQQTARYNLHAFRWKYKIPNRLFPFSFPFSERFPPASREKTASPRLTLSRSGLYYSRRQSSFPARSSRGRVYPVPVLPGFAVSASRSLQPFLVPCFSPAGFSRSS